MNTLIILATLLAPHVDGAARATYSAACIVQATDHYEVAIADGRTEDQANDAYAETMAACMGEPLRAAQRENEKNY